MTPLCPRRRCLYIEMRQWNSLVAKYDMDFWIVAANSKWNSEMLFSGFYRGLSAKIKDKLTTGELPGHLHRPWHQRVPPAKTTWWPRPPRWTGPAATSWTGEQLVTPAAWPQPPSEEEGTSIKLGSVMAEYHKLRFLFSKPHMTLWSLIFSTSTYLATSP